MARKNFWEKEEEKKIAQPEQNLLGGGIKTQSSPSQSSKSVLGNAQIKNTLNPNLPKIGNISSSFGGSIDSNFTDKIIGKVPNIQNYIQNKTPSTNASTGGSYDEQMMSAEDYKKLSQLQAEWNTTTDPVRRAEIHREANRLRAGYGYVLSGSDKVDLGSGGFDKTIMSPDDFNLYRQAVADYYSASTQAEKDAAHAKAEEIRNKYGYSMGTTGGDFTPNNPIPGVSDNTMANMLHWMASANNPTGNSEWYDQWQNLYEQYMNRGPFEYDMNEDPLYQQYEEQYTRLGNQAMQDTLGQAAALTGGYDSSYSQSAGQQAYQGYLDQLNDVVPELYNQAYGRWQDAGDLLLNQGSAAAQIYGQQVSDYWNNLNYWTQQAQNESGNYWNQQESEMNQQQIDFNKQQTNYSNLVTSISNTGYKPTDAELQAAGMTRAEANMWLQMYQRELAKTSFSGGSGGGSSRSSGGRSYRSGGGGGYDYSPSSNGNSTDYAAQFASQYTMGASGRSGTFLDSPEVQEFANKYGIGPSNPTAWSNFLGKLKKAGFIYSWEAK